MFWRKLFPVHVFSGGPPPYRSKWTFFLIQPKKVLFRRGPPPPNRAKLGGFSPLEKGGISRPFGGPPNRPGFPPLEKGGISGGILAACQTCPSQASLPAS